MKQRLSSKQKKQLKALLEKASHSFAIGGMEILEKICQQIDTLQANHPDVENFRGVIAMQAGDVACAIAHFRSAIAQASKRSEFHSNLAAGLLQQQQYTEALKVYRQAIALDKHALLAQIGYANVLMAMEAYEQAITVLEQLPHKYQHDSNICMALFRACYGAAQLDQARKPLERILRQQANHAGAHYGLALLAMHDGRFDDAMSEVQTVIAAEPGYTDVYKILADIHRFTSSTDADLVNMIAQYDSMDDQASGRASLAFALGKIMADIGEYDRAFQFYENANTCRRQDMDYDHADALAVLTSVSQTYTATVPALNSGSTNSAPIFILGMPRCGSTLVEQILAAHPDVCARGECNAFQLAASTCCETEEDVLQPAHLSGFSSQQWQHLGGAYLQRLHVDDALHVTDKTLPNIAWVGAIQHALPAARIVHVRRNPLDTCLSIFRNDLQGSGFQYGFDLQELGEYYAAYLQLMQHWRDVLPDGVMYEIDYEQLVSHQESETRKLLEACGLSWHAPCLQFNQQRNAVFTASVVQVRGTMNNNSVAGWKRYARHLQPLIDLLGES